MLLETLSRNVIASWESGDLAGAVRDLDNYLKEVDAERQRHELTISAARSHYEEPSDHDIEIDDEPLLSIGENGVWVSAWVHVPIDDGTPKPPPGYTAEELERDSPYNQWLYGV